MRLGVCVCMCVYVIKCLWLKKLILFFGAQRRGLEVGWLGHFGGLLRITSHCSLFQCSVFPWHYRVAIAISFKGRKLWRGILGILGRNRQNDKRSKRCE